MSEIEDGKGTKNPWENEDRWQLVAATLPYGVYSEHAALSSSIDIKLGNLSGRLLLPDTRSNESGWKLTAPAGPPRWVGHSESSSTAQDWGYWNSPSLATIRSVVFHIEQTVYSDGRPTYPRNFLREARRWVSDLSDWLAVLAGGTTDIVSDHRLTWENWDIELDALTESHHEWLEPKYPLSLTQWVFAVQKTSNNEAAPFPLVLMAAAQRANAEGDYRRAVFDAASAAETVLRAALGSYLSQKDVASPDFYSWAMKRKTFGPLLEACETFGLPLPTRTKQRLVEVRNKIAHPSTLPSEKAMREAVGVAAQIVQEHFAMDASLRNVIFPAD